MGAGSFVVDDRSSGGTLNIADTDWCRHCQAVIVMKANSDWCRKEGGWCVRCFGPLCGGCARAMAEGGPIRSITGTQWVDKGICTPFKKQVDDMIRRRRP
jgi:hypothetical protein